ncbi:MAG: glycosyltransferase family 2 protein [Imperialibacter sp.]|uniref:glycosyltransferase family 2 protein n=1 Tax=Imperialibacter sp. TaxID=2038411 RepID=UPI0032EFDBB1
MQPFDSLMTDSMAVNFLPIAVVVPTYNRPVALKATLLSLSKQSYLPKQVVVIDASDKEAGQWPAAQAELEAIINIDYYPADQKGAASQRNQGVKSANQPFILFMDDDVFLETGCIAHLWDCIQSDKSIGGVNAMITNQKYTQPGKLTLFMARVFTGYSLPSLAGRCIGPGWNFLPQDGEDLPPYVRVEWLNSTCTLYRKEALPDPVFGCHFTGYSLMEDLTLSLQVGKQWRLFNSRVSRIYHDTQPGDHKKSVFALARMSVVNRYFITHSILNRTYPRASILLLESFFLLSMLSSFKNIRHIPAKLLGILAGMWSTYTKKYEA